MKHSPYLKEKISPADAGSLVQIKTSGPSLSKEQHSFNKLVKRIEMLQQKIKDDTSKLAELAKFYHQHVTPSALQMTSLKIQLCKLLDLKRTRVKLSRVANEQLDDNIREILDEIVHENEPDDETRALYQKYFDESPEESQELIDDMANDMFASMFEDEFGFKIDPSHLKGGPDFTKIEESINQQQEKIDQKKKSQKRSKSAIRREELNQRKEEIKNRSIRSIYLSLAKLLHPDSETDATLKLEKEEVMKLVTTAYRDRNLLRLLELEMQWVASHKRLLDELDKETLAGYLQLLRDQVNDLEEEHFMLRHSPVYNMVWRYQAVKMAAAKTDIRRIGDALKRTVNEIRNDLDALNTERKESPVIKKYSQWDRFNDVDQVPF